jgi:uncharacterized protein YyaL (SSP411 family)
MARHDNRLAREASPYLLQHAHNPVDWFPWGEEALERARREDKPILLSIGYAACHWCHVMERESFEDEAIAAKMNELFVNVKVDREERPDLDHVYQMVVQLMGRSGGWPLTVFLTPEQRPFFAGTYFPPAQRHGMPGLPTVLDAVIDAYRARRGEVETQAQEITRAIGRVTRLRVGADPSAIGPGILHRATRRLLSRFDDTHGGFGSRPKFPNTMSLEVMLRRGELEGDPACKAAVKKALDGMQQGGIHDHLRGGFARYSTDERWLVPHFEKMLYDNALLLRLYVDGWRVFGDEAYAKTASGIVGWLLSEMIDDQGGFFASQDADSEGVEGKYFVWTEAQVRAALGDDTRAADVAVAHFGITAEGNFEHSGATVLSAARSLDEVATALGIEVAEAASALARARASLLAARYRRVPPARDDKVLASWNALMIEALADAGRALGEPSWVGAATRAFAAIEARLVEGGRVRRFYHPTRPRTPGAPGAPERWGFLDDHAYLGNAALGLHEATGEPRYVATARAIADRMIAHHLDPAGGFFQTADDAEDLIHRAHDVFDNAVPSGGAMAALLCLRLGGLCDDGYTAHGERALEAIAPAAAEDAFALGQWVCVLDRLVRGPMDVVLVGDAAGINGLADAVFRAWLPNRALVAVRPEDAASAAAAPLLAEGKAPPSGGGAVAYVCRGRTCSAPIGDAAELTRELHGAARAPVEGRDETG